MAEGGGWGVGVTDGDAEGEGSGVGTKIETAVGAGSGVGLGVEPSDGEAVGSGEVGLAEGVSSGVGVGVGVGVGHGGTMSSQEWRSWPVPPISWTSWAQRSCHFSRSGGAGVLSAEPGKTR